MGKRSRRRVGGAPTAEPTGRVSPEPVEVAEKDAPPKPPWAPFPLSEIAVVVALVLAVGGFVAGGKTGTTVLVTGLLLGSAAGFEQALREHRSGFRSHAAVLAGLPAAVAVGALALLHVPSAVMPVAAVGVLIACFLPIRSDFVKRKAERELRNQQR